MESRDRNQGCADTENGAETAQASTASDSTLASATEKDTVRSRLWELHRLLNNRKGSFSATFQKNAEANSRTYDLNQKKLCKPWIPWRRSTKPS